ncbi:hypothetical protein [Leifsonia sp. Leaf264]|uniref:hypothetical protein n=1 Tax=Leifsonia sp. Leaf264 TaxID=1736314 RepID=UPI000701D9EE|nr:hypothetical protein [Leifsonia sp. Leaf264]KQP01376.1 hypothetical protein ASF30_01810 [Leifsonia sp. Leaf264]
MPTTPILDRHLDELLEERADVLGVAVFDLVREITDEISVTWDRKSEEAGEEFVWIELMTVDLGFDVIVSLTGEDWAGVRYLARDWLADYVSEGVELVLAC